MVYYVVSDPHGHATALRVSLMDAGYFQDPRPHKLIILGDLFDRGREALALQRFVLGEIMEDRLILVKGNHEDLFEDLALISHGRAVEPHLSNRTYDTGLQLTGMTMVEAFSNPERFSDALLDTPFYKEIIPRMLPYYETETHLFVHGYLPCDVDDNGLFRYRADWREADDADWRKARWINGMEAVRSAPAEKTVIVGHWHTSYGHSRFEHNGPEFGSGAVFTPFIQNGIIALDACTVRTGMVNCIVIDDNDL